MQQLVLDLRNNGGGLVNQAYRVANTFLGRGQAIFTQKGRLDGTENTYNAENAAPDNTPIVMLVNRNTASASEILAGALQDHDRALIVGENTFGKGLVQNPFVLEYGSMLLLTIAKYETPVGRLIQRDYSDGNLYDYYTGAAGDERKLRRDRKARKAKPIRGQNGLQRRRHQPGHRRQTRYHHDRQSAFSAKTEQPDFRFTCSIWLTAKSKVLKITKLTDRFRSNTTSKRRIFLLPTRFFKISKIRNRKIRIHAARKLNAKKNSSNAQCEANSSRRLTARRLRFRFSTNTTTN
jgi:hypothetical protein